MWCDNPSDSGKVHSDVRRRWDEGDALVRETMREVAGYAETGADALRRGVDVVERVVVREPRARSARARESFERARESFRVGNV